MPFALKPVSRVAGSAWRKRYAQNADNAGAVNRLKELFERGFDQGFDIALATVAVKCPEHPAQARIRLVRLDPQLLREIVLGVVDPPGRDEIGGQDVEIGSVSSQQLAPEIFVPGKIEQRVVVLPHLPPDEKARVGNNLDPVAFISDSEARQNEPIPVYQSDRVAINVHTILRTRTRPEIVRVVFIAQLVKYRRRDG